MIVDLVGGKGQVVPISWEEAVATRQALMDQRGALVEYVNDDMEEVSLLNLSLNLSRNLSLNLSLNLSPNLSLNLANVSR